MFEEGYYWAKHKDGDGEWEIVEVWDGPKQIVVSRCGSDELFNCKDFEFGEKIERRS